MRQVTRKGLITMAAASGVIAMGGGAAHADSAAQGSATNSPGVLSGNTVQVPVHVPVNACGNTVNVIGALNPAFANSCANKGGGHPGGGAVATGHTSNSPGVGSGNTIQAPIDAPVNVCGNSLNVVGIGNPAFGNDCVNDESGRPQHPGHPGNPGHPGQPHHPGTPHHPGKPHEPGQHKPCPPEQPSHPQQPGHPGVPQHPVSPIAHQPAKPAQPAAPARPAAPVTQTVTAPKAPAASLAHTGSEGMGFAAPAAAGLVLGGAVLYRRGRAAQR
ncbi:chaplin family protein [Streptomyces violascens]|uniref:chaplin n=1 Tax=Streptomyces violascens TaxID=67381 RepID=UPI0036652E7B